MNQKLIFKNFNKQINKQKKKYRSPFDFFNKARNSLSRVELMILDSAFKGMPLDNLYRTLILKQEDYLQIIQNVTEKLKIMKNQ